MLWTLKRTLKKLSIFILTKIEKKSGERATMSAHHAIQNRSVLGRRSWGRSRGSDGGSSGSGLGENRWINLTSKCWRILRDRTDRVRRRRKTGGAKGGGRSETNGKCGGGARTTIKWTRNHCKHVNKRRNKMSRIL